MAVANEIAPIVFDLYNEIVRFVYEVSSVFLVADLVRRDEFTKSQFCPQLDDNILQMSLSPQGLGPDFPAPFQRSTVEVAARFNHPREPNQLMIAPLAYRTNFTIFSSSHLRSVHNIRIPQPKIVGSQEPLLMPTGEFPAFARNIKRQVLLKRSRMAKLNSSTESNQFFNSVSVGGN